MVCARESNSSCPLIGEPEIHVASQFKMLQQSHPGNKGLEILEETLVFSPHWKPKEAGNKGWQ